MTSPCGLGVFFFLFFFFLGFLSLCPATKVKVKINQGRFNEVAEGGSGPVWPACNSLEVDARLWRRLIQPGRPLQVLHGVIRV